MKSLPSASVDMILPAAGKSQRFAGTRKKIFSELAGKWVWQHAVERLRNRPEVRRIIIAIDAIDRPIWEGECGAAIELVNAELIEGGDQRVDSVRAALRHLPDAQWVAVHDAARPLISDSDLTKLFAVAVDSPAAILACQVRGTVKREGRDLGRIAATVSRQGLWEALTPQIFRADILRESYHRWKGFPVTDDAQIVERSGHVVRIVEGSSTNLKITVAEDLSIAEALNSRL